MLALAFIGAIQQEVSKDTIKMLVATIKSEAVSDCLVVCNGNGLFATASRLEEQLELLFDSGIDLVIVGEQGISRNCCRSVFSKAEWPVIKALNLPGSTVQTSVKSIKLSDMAFDFISTVDGSGKVPVEQSYLKLDEFFKNKKDNSVVVINENGTDYKYLQALAWRYSRFDIPVLIFGAGSGLLSYPTLKYGGKSLLQGDVGMVATDETICGIDPEQWWRKNIDRRPLTLLPKWGPLHCDYTIVWFEGGKIKDFTAKSVRL